MPSPHSDIFSYFPKILRSRNRDLKTIHNAFRGYNIDDN